MNSENTTLVVERLKKQVVEIQTLLDKVSKGETYIDLEDGTNYLFANENAFFMCSMALIIFCKSIFNFFFGVFKFCLLSHSSN